MSNNMSKRFWLEKVFDPVLSIHLKDGWTAVRPIHGYLQHDEDSVRLGRGYSVSHADCPPPAEFDLRKLRAIASSCNPKLAAKES